VVHTVKFQFDEVVRNLRQLVSEVAFVLGLLILVLVCASSPIRATAAEDAALTSELASSAPPEFKRLIERGKVQFVFDDNRLKSISKHGLTQFHFDINQTFNCRINPTRAGNKSATRISVAITDFKFQISHTVTLRTTKDKENWWNDRILLHEFDHVAISTDPRVSQLVRSLVGTSFTFVAESDSGQSKPSQDEVLALVRAELNKRRNAIQDCVQKNYDLLDGVSGSGTRAIQERNKFFEQLFMRDNLLKNDFNIGEDVKKLIASPKYKKIAGHYDLLTKP
jgi:hypothetical protein